MPFAFDARLVVCCCCCCCCCVVLLRSSRVENRDKDKPNDDDEEGKKTKTLKTLNFSLLFVANPCSCVVAYLSRADPLETHIGWCQYQRTTYSRMVVDWGNRQMPQAAASCDNPQSGLSWESVAR